MGGTSSISRLPTNAPAGTVCADEPDYCVCSTPAAVAGPGSIHPADASRPFAKAWKFTGAQARSRPTKDRPLTTHYSLSTWRKDPTAGPALREPLAQGGHDESKPRPAWLQSLDKPVAISKGRFSRSLMDELPHASAAPPRLIRLTMRRRVVGYSVSCWSVLLRHHYRHRCRPGSVAAQPAASPPRAGARSPWTFPSPAWKHPPPASLGSTTYDAACSP